MAHLWYYHDWFRFDSIRHIMKDNTLNNDLFEGYVYMLCTRMNMRLRIEFIYCNKLQ